MEHCAYTVCNEQTLSITVLDPSQMVCMMAVFRNNTCLEALINSLDVLSLCPDSFFNPTNSPTSAPPGAVGKGGVLNSDPFVPRKADPQAIVPEVI